MVKLLLENKPEMINAKNDDGRTPLYYALENGKFSPERTQYSKFGATNVP